MNNETKKNQLPPIVVNLIETLTDPGLPMFQKELAAATLERINSACITALSEYNMVKAKVGRKRGF